MPKVYSFSQKKMYATCPRKYQLAYIVKDRKKELPSECMLAGSDGHREIAGYLKGGNRPDFLPDNFDGFVSRIGQGDRLIEEKIEIDFFGFGLVGYIDLAIIDGQKASIVDWKTGYQDGDVEQLKIYAAAILERNPDIMVFVCYFYYTGKEGHYTREVYTREEIAEYMYDLESDLSEIHEAKDYPAKVNPYCKTCPYSWDCFEAKKYAFLAVRNEQEFLEVMRKKELAEAYADQAKDVMKQWMCENGQTTVIDGITKAYLGTTVTMHTGRLKKDEIIDIIIEHDLNQDKKVLGKLKVDELATILSEISAKGIQQDEEIESVEIPKVIPTLVLDVNEVNSATKKSDLYLAFEALLAARNTTWDNYCERRGLCKETPLDGLTREKMYQEYKILAATKPENVPTDTNISTEEEKSNAGQIMQSDDENIPLEDLPFSEVLKIEPEMPKVSKMELVQNIKGLLMKTNQEWKKFAGIHGFPEVSLTKSEVGDLLQAEDMLEEEAGHICTGVPPF